MKKFDVTSAARADLRAIRAYTEKIWGKARKDEYLAAIQKQFKLLRRRPEIAAIRRDIGHRCLSVGRHLIFYSYDGTTVTVIRILHQGMDLHTHF